MNNLDPILWLNEDDEEVLLYSIAHFYRKVTVIEVIEYSVVFHSVFGPVPSITLGKEPVEAEYVQLVEMRLTQHQANTLKDCGLPEKFRITLLETKFLYSSLGPSRSW